MTASQVGFLGPASSFTHQAARKFSASELIAYPSIPATLKAVAEGVLQAAIVPVENSLEGSVHATIDFLWQAQKLTVKKEIVLPIRQQLLGYSKVIKGIYSHPQALAQSQNYLQEHYPNVPQFATSSTTAACKYVAAHPEEQLAAIAGKEAGERYDLTLLGADIQDNDLNQTRFWVVEQTPSQQVAILSQQKMSLLVTMPNNLPGALHKMLAPFGWREIDLVKIESRPLKTSLGEYFFVLDLLVNQDPRLIENALTELRLLGGTAKVLGCYPVEVCS